MSENKIVLSDGKIPEGNILPGKEPKGITLSFKATQSQNNLLKERSAQVNMSMSDYIRKTLFDPVNRNIVIEKGGDIFIKLAGIYDLLVDMMQKLDVKDRDFGALNGILSEISGKLDSVSRTFEKVNEDISFIFNSIDAIKNSLYSEEDPDDDTVYDEDNICDGDIQEEGCN